MDTRDRTKENGVLMMLEPKEERILRNLMAVVDSGDYVPSYLRGEISESRRESIYKEMATLMSIIKQSYDNESKREKEQKQ